MKLLSVNVSLPKTVTAGGRTVTTSIFKEPVAGRVLLRRLNLEGDGQADLRAHGGQNKAVYAYPVEHYAFWERELGRTDLRPGQFGENFTVKGMLEEEVCLGDTFRVGSATVAVTQPRVPCYKLGVKMQAAEFPKRFLKSGRTGFYLRVVEEGEVGAGDVFQLLERDPASISVRGLWHLVYEEPDNVEGARQALSRTALAREWREPLEQRLLEA
jgi:MOSC domain-containing protein YiiM